MNIRCKNLIRDRLQEAIYQRLKAKTSNRVKVIVMGLVLAMLCIQSPVFAQRGLSKKIKEGNKLYNAGEYDQALTKYNDAQIEAPTNPEVFFNMGNVLFRQGKHKEAMDLYQKSMEKGDINVEAKALYNIGNALFQQGQLREALEYYKQALERSPDDADAKYNIEYTERMIKEMISKAQETKQKEQQDQQKCKAQEQQGSQASNDNEEEKNGQEKQAQFASSPEDEKKTGEKKEEQRNESGKEEDDERQAQETRVGKSDADNEKDLSKEEAEYFLSAFEGDKKDNPFLNQQKSRRGRGYYVEKDW